MVETRGEDGKNTAPGIRSPLREVGLIGMVFGWMMRRFSNIAVGAGVPSSVQVIEVEVDTWLGHVRVLNVHTGIAVGKIIISILSAFAIVFFRFPFRMIFFWMIFVTLMLPVEDGRVRLGTWQGIWLGEHRIHGGSRHIVATLMGE